MAKDILSFRCDGPDHENVVKALAWVEASTAAEQAISGEESVCIVRQAFARCRGPELPGRSDDDTTGICQLIFEPTELSTTDPARQPSVTLPEPPEIDRHIEIRYR